MLSTTQNMPDLEIGDIVFTCVAAFLFSNISKASLCWSNHVGIIVGHDGNDYIVAESCIPFSKKTSLTKFIKRSHKQHVAIRRLSRKLSDTEQSAIINEIPSKLNIFYHLGFDYDAKRQYCSKFVYQIYKDALNTEVGKIETFEQLLKTNPNASLTFWKIWFFGRIPWQRRTVTPASLWFCSHLETIYDSMPDIAESLLKQGQ